MKSILFGLWLFLSSSFCLSAQVNNMANNLKQQAGKMSQALVAGDYATFVHYIYPKIVQLQGGSDKIITILTQTVQQLSAQGMKFQKVTLDEPTPFVKGGGQLQSTIQQHTEFKMPQGRTVATSTLICLSADNGLNWTFVDVNNKSLGQIRQLLPNLNSAIVIPPPQAPVHYDH
jgi:hypothetical protein